MVCLIFNFNIFLKILGNSWAVPTRMDIMLGEVPKGQAREKKNAHFMKVVYFYPNCNFDKDS